MLLLSANTQISSLKTTLSTLFILYTSPVERQYLYFKLVFLSGKHSEKLSPWQSESQQQFTSQEFSVKSQIQLPKPTELGSFKFGLLSTFPYYFGNGKYRTEVQSMGISLPMQSIKYVQRETTFNIIFCIKIIKGRHYQLRI